MTLDHVVVGGVVVDGTGGPARRTDVGIAAGRIAVLGDLADRTDVPQFDAAGLTVAPGFIDPHAHVEVALLEEGCVEAKVSQGVTTEVLGQDGLSYAPLPAARLAEQAHYLEALNGRYRPPAGAARSDGTAPGRSRAADTMHTFAQFLAGYAGRTAQNVAALVPYGAVRLTVAGWDARPLSEPEIAAAGRLVDDGLEAGALGVALGLDYAPQRSASTEELEALGAAVARRNAVLVAHARTRDLGAAGSVRELVDIARATGARIHVSHLRASEALPVVDAALDAGVRISFDVYPYERASSMLTMHLPPWVLDGGPAAALARLRDPAVRDRLRGPLEARFGDPDDITIANVGRDRFPELVGRSLADAARHVRGDVVDAVVELLVANELVVGYVGGRVQPESLAACLAHPVAVGCSDAILTGQRPHPRGWGAFARYLATVMMPAGPFTLEEAVHRLSGRTAALLGLAGRGTIEPGHAADLVLFDPPAVRDLATDEQPRRPAAGIRAVLVNGEVAWADGTPTGRMPGQVLVRSTNGGAR